MVTNYASAGTVSVLLGNGDGTFQAAVKYAVGEYAFDVAVADLNGDGIPDLAVANQGADTVSVLLGKGDGTFHAAVQYVAGYNPQSVVVADFNGDGILDLALALGVGGEGSDAVAILLGKGDGTLHAAQSYAVGDGPRTVAVGNLNGDGILDLVVANDQSNTVSVLLGGGTAPSRPHRATPPAAVPPARQRRISTATASSTSPCPTWWQTPTGMVAA